MRLLKEDSSMIKMILKKLSELAILDCCLILSSASPAFALSYHFDAVDGNDANDCTAPERACKTIEKANQQQYNFGDKILFRGGQTFQGSLELNPEKVLDDPGTPFDGGPALLEITSYSVGGLRENAKIQGSSGIGVTDIGQVRIHDIDLAGTSLTNGGIGIAFFNGSGRAVEHISIGPNVSASGFGLGLQIFANDLESTIRTVRIDGLEVSYNGEGGMGIYGAPNILSGTQTGPRSVEDVVIRNAKVNYNKGAGILNGGYGASLFGIANLLIENNELIGNGGEGPGANSAALFGFHNLKVTIRKNRIYYTSFSGDPATGANSDGNGINLRGSGLSIYENEIVGNQGSCILVDGGGHPSLDEGGTTEDLEFFNNLCLYNGAGDPETYFEGRDVQASFRVFYSAKKVKAYNNLFVVAGSVEEGVGGVFEINRWRPDGAISDIKFLNNLVVVARGNVPFVQIRFPEDNERIQITGNNYFNPEGASKFENCRPYCTEIFNTLQEFREGTGHEMLDGLPVGRSEDAYVALWGENTGRIPAYSPVIGAGVDLNRFDVAPPETDFFGNPRNGHFTIGAHEPGASDPPPGGG